MIDKLQIGERLRLSRQKLGLSLRALAEQTGLSASFLSQVELGQTMPSVGSLQRIAESLGLTVSMLLRQDDTQNPVMRASARGALRSEWSKATMESLVSASSDERLQAILIRLDKEGRTGVTHYAIGRRLFAYCTTGEAVAMASDPTEEFLLGSGDSLVVDGPRNVAWENRAAGVTELIVVAARLA